MGLLFPSGLYVSFSAENSFLLTFDFSSNFKSQVKHFPLSGKQFLVSTILGQLWSLAFTLNYKLHFITIACFLVHPLCYIVYFLRARTISDRNLLLNPAEGSYIQ